MLKLIGWLLIFPSMFVRGWAIKWTWLWFVVPVTGLRPINKAAAYGLAIFLTAWSLSTGDMYAAEAAGENKKNVILYPIATMIVLAFTVGVGWIVKTYFL